MVIILEFVPFEYEDNQRDLTWEINFIKRDIRGGGPSTPFVDYEEGISKPFNRKGSLPPTGYIELYSEESGHTYRANVLHSPKLDVSDIARVLTEDSGVPVESRVFLKT